jgi:hypothetical protein
VDDDTGCVEGEVSLHFVVPDLQDRRRVEFACLPGSDMAEGSAVIVRNFGNDEVRCAGVGPGGAFSTPIPADTGDPLQVEIYRNAANRVDYSDCTFTGDDRPLRIDVISTWRNVEGRPRPGQCWRCANYQGEEWLRGDPLVAPTEGLGLRRQSPNLRRLAALGQIALDPADPINYARHMFVEPRSVDDTVARARSVLAITTVGDPVVPPANGAAYARAAGILPYLPPDAPEELAEHRAPPSFGSLYGIENPNDLLIDLHVIEGVARLGRHPVEGAPNFLFDADDLSEGLQQFDAGGGDQVPLDSEEPAFRPQRLDPPLRWVRESRLMDGTADMEVWSPTSGAPVSAFLNAMIVPRGEHVFRIFDPDRPFDESLYLVGLVGWYLASDGTEVLYHTDPEGHHCLEDDTCRFGP